MTTCNLYQEKNITLEQYVKLYNAHSLNLLNELVRILKSECCLKQPINIHPLLVNYANSPYGIAAYVHRSALSSKYAPDVLAHLVTMKNSTLLYSKGSLRLYISALHFNNVTPDKSSVNIRVGDKEYNFPLLMMSQEYVNIDFRVENNTFVRGKFKILSYASIYVISNLAKLFGKLLQPMAQAIMATSVIVTIGVIYTSFLDALLKQRNDELRRILMLVFIIIIFFLLVKDVESLISEQQIISILAREELSAYLRGIQLLLAEHPLVSYGVNLYNLSNMLVSLFLPLLVSLVIIVEALEPGRRHIISLVVLSLYLTVVEALRLVCDLYFELNDSNYISMHLSILLSLLALQSLTPLVIPYILRASCESVQH